MIISRVRILSQFWLTQILAILINLLAPQGDGYTVTTSSILSSPSLYQCPLHHSWLDVSLGYKTQNQTWTDRSSFMIIFHCTIGFKAGPVLTWIIFLSNIIFSFYFPQIFALKYAWNILFGFFLCLKYFKKQCISHHVLSWCIKFLSC